MDGLYLRPVDLLQKGRGLGPFAGLLRGALAALRPAASAVGRTLVRAAKSDAAKSLGKTLGQQALDSGLNLTKEILQGNDLQQAVDREVTNFRTTGANLIAQAQAKRKNPPTQNKVVKKKKKGQVLHLKKARPSLASMRRYNNGDY